LIQHKMPTAIVSSIALSYLTVSTSLYVLLLRHGPTVNPVLQIDKRRFAYLSFISPIDLSSQFTYWSFGMWQESFLLFSSISLLVVIRKSAAKENFKYFFISLVLSASLTLFHVWHRLCNYPNNELARGWLSYTGASSDIANKYIFLGWANESVILNIAVLLLQFTIMFRWLQSRRVVF